MNIFWNFVAWAITLVPASIWWRNTVVMTYRTARSWADKVAVCIIVLIFIAIVVTTIATICAIISGVNVFGVP